MSDSPHPTHLPWKCIISVNRKTLRKIIPTEPNLLWFRKDHVNHFCRVVLRKKMSDLYFCELKMELKQRRKWERRCGHYLAISEQRREVEEEGLAEGNRLNRVVEVFTLVKLHLERRNKAGWACEWNHDEPFISERIFVNMGVWKRNCPVLTGHMCNAS